MIRYDWNSAKYAIELTASVNALFSVYPKEWFQSTVKHQFEDIVINLPCGYDSYLKQVFGDYMSLPPEKDRHPRHNTVLIDLNHPYKQYKGVYYCVGKGSKE